MFVTSGLNSTRVAADGGTLQIITDSPLLPTLSSPNSAFSFASLYFSECDLTVHVCAYWCTNNKSVGLKNFDVIVVWLYDQSGNKLGMEEKLYYISWYFNGKKIAMCWISQQAKTHKKEECCTNGIIHTNKYSDQIVALLKWIGVCRLNSVSYSSKTFKCVSCISLCKK
jgi:hypothetical protein